MADFKYYRPDNFPPIVKNLIIINVLVFIAQITLGSRFGITEKISLYPIMPDQLHNILVEMNYYEPSEKFHPYQIATHMFAHSPGFLLHIVINMFVLWMFGRILENVWGPKRFLFFYLACGVGAAALHLIVQYFGSLSLLQAILSNDPTWKNHLGAAAPALGASGAVMGLMAAFAFLFPNTELYIMFIPFPIKAKWAVLGYIAYDLIFGVASFSGGSSIAHFAHLGGVLTGFIIVLIWNKSGRQRFY